MSDDRAWTPKLQIPDGQVIVIGDTTYTYKGRARDRDRRHVFTDKNGLSRDFSDAEYHALITGIGSNGRALVKALTNADVRSIESGRKESGHGLFQDADKEEKERVGRLLTFIRGWEKAGRPSRTDKVLEPLIKGLAVSNGLTMISPSTLRRAIVSWDGSPDSLVARHDLKGNTHPKADPDDVARCTKLALDAYFIPERPTVSHVHDYVRKMINDHNALTPPDAKKLKVVSRWTIDRAINDEGQFASEYSRIGPLFAVRNRRAVTKGPKSDFANQRWEIDGSPLPVIAVDDETGLPIGRPTLMVCLDHHTTALTGFDLSWGAESIRTALSCLRMAMLPKEDFLAELGVNGTYPMSGKPSLVVGDSVAYLRSHDGQFSGICDRIGAEKGKHPSMHPYYKAHVERSIRTFCLDSMQIQQGSTFENIFKRSREKPPETVAVCTIRELRKTLAEYVVNQYHIRPHRGLGLRSRLSLWKESVDQFGIVPSPSREQLSSILGMREHRTVSAQGVEVNGLFYNSDSLMIYRQASKSPERVEVIIDPDDVTQAWWVDPHTKERLPIFLPARDRRNYARISLARLEVVRALTRNNPEVFSNMSSASKARGLMMEAVLGRTPGKRMANRLHAKRAFEKLALRARDTFKDGIEDSDDDRSMSEILLPLHAGNTISHEQAPDILDDGKPNVKLGHFASSSIAEPSKTVEQPSVASTRAKVLLTPELQAGRLNVVDQTEMSQSSQHEADELLAAIASFSNNATKVER